MMRPVPALARCRASAGRRGVPWPQCPCGLRLPALPRRRAPYAKADSPLPPARRSQVTDAMSMTSCHDLDSISRSSRRSFAQDDSLRLVMCKKWPRPDLEQPCTTRAQPAPRPPSVPPNSPTTCWRPGGTSAARRRASDLGGACARASMGLTTAAPCPGSRAPTCGAQMSDQHADGPRGPTSRRRRASRRERPCPPRACHTGRLSTQSAASPPEPTTSLSRAPLPVAPSPLTQSAPRRTRRPSSRPPRRLVRLAR